MSLESKWLLSREPQMKSSNPHSRGFPGWDKVEMKVFCISKQVDLRFSFLLLVQEVTYYFFFLSLAPLEKGLELS